MKKIIMIAAMLVAVVCANAQNEEGQLTLMPKAGINLATYSGDDGAKMRIGPVGGVELEYGLSDNFGLACGVLYSMQGAKVDGTDMKIDAHYINVPILAQYYVIDGLAIKAGVQPGFCVSSDWNDPNVFDLSIPVGLSYEISRFVIDARYNIGVTKILDGFTDKNSVIQFTLGYKLEL